MAKAKPSDKSKGEALKCAVCGAPAKHLIAVDDRRDSPRCDKHKAPGAR
jgi:hypothetical protein